MVCNGNSSEFCGGPGALNVYDYGMQVPTRYVPLNGPFDSIMDMPRAHLASRLAWLRDSPWVRRLVGGSCHRSETQAQAQTTDGARHGGELRRKRQATLIVSSASSGGGGTAPSSTPSAACPSQPTAVGSSWSWYGCYTEATNMRALSDKTYAADSMTLASCAQFCAGSQYFGVEYSRECYCGSKLNAGSTRAPASDCSMVCSGSKCDLCGAGNRLSVYTLGGGGGAGAGTPGTTSVVNTPSITGTGAGTGTSSQAPVPTGLPAGWKTYGCWVDGVNGRILDKQLPDDPSLTLESCAQACNAANYTIAGAEYSRQCFCGNDIVNGGTTAKSDSECNTACAGNAKENCGGGGRMTIMSLNTPVVRAPPAPAPTVGSWQYQGCYTDNVNNQRTFFWQNIMEKTMTPKKCLDLCGSYGYAAAGLEYGQECYCGDPPNIQVRGSTKAPDSDCNVACAGDGSLICGGGNRLTTYFWKGDPFYSWSFPAAGSPDAGSYEFLIGGVCIPLITSQAVNGKVTFLEKWGTGPPNSTGAYELDLSLVGDAAKAWRAMHVKTDIFCAGGVTLPDKAGRQLNVGGWSGDSTYGVRLYTPDGSPGVASQNDWQENAAVLKLQNGRWYPTAMVMANGSVLVIGGEEGSNGKPVPTLEILPYTGTKPLYMEWLERTDPNNLYPFTCVLPSGGIFVAYFNEARILNENTFATIKTLPNMPTAVNDPMGGRTYPLEGTAVLLPQKAPYNDPLGVLICGGSTNGPGNALDNCVSIYPDAANPTWALERMPSQRVMSCMAPLPDGTYLILNGAFHGVAGFGLATGPNMNALLYDPSKPLGSRITVMANTTVARLYHSEAITLLDGRVLVSGSDPEDGVNPQEYRVETFTPPYLKRGKPRPTFTIRNKDWGYGQQVSFTLGTAARNGAISASLLGSVSSTHGNSMGARTLLPAVSCTLTTCTVTSPPGKYIAPPGWYQFFVLDGGIPAVGVFVRIGGDPAGLGNWPKGSGFSTPGV